MQHGWDKLREAQQIESIDLVPPNRTARFLNQFQWDAEKVLPPHSVITIAGQDGPEFTNLVNGALRRHFGDRVDVFDRVRQSQPARGETVTGGIAILTVFGRQVVFDADFLPDEDKAFDFFDSRGRPHKVQGFGSWKPAQQQSNVGCGRVLAHQPGTELALALKTSDPDEFAVLFHDPAQSSIATAYARVSQLLQEVTASDPASSEAPPGAYINGSDSIRLPKLALSQLGQFQEQLKGTYRTPHTPPGRHWRITRAIQSIDLSLDHTGAGLEVRSFLIVPSFLSSGGIDAAAKEPEKPQPRHFIFNKPFFLMFWRKNATVPYLVAHIDGAGLVAWQK